MSARLSVIRPMISSFPLRLKAGRNSNRLCLSGEERDGEGGRESGPWRGRAALARPAPQRASGAALGGLHGGPDCRSGTKGQPPLVFPRAGGPLGEGRGATRSNAVRIAGDRKIGRASSRERVCLYV